MPTQAQAPAHLWTDASTTAPGGFPRDVDDDDDASFDEIDPRDAEEQLTFVALPETMPGTFGEQEDAAEGEWDDVGEVQEDTWGRESWGSASIASSWGEGEVVEYDEGEEGEEEEEDAWGGAALSCSWGNSEETLVDQNQEDTWGRVSWGSMPERVEWDEGQRFEHLEWDVDSSEDDTESESDEGFDAESGAGNSETDSFAAVANSRIGPRATNLRNRYLPVPPPPPPSLAGSETTITAVTAAASISEKAMLSEEATPLEEPRPSTSPLEKEVIHSTSPAEEPNTTQLTTLVRIQSAISNYRKDLSNIARGLADRLFAEPQPGSIIVEVKRLNACLAVPLVLTMDTLCYGIELGLGARDVKGLLLREEVTVGWR